MDIKTQIAKMTITPEILQLISLIDEFKGTWRAIRSLAPDRLAILKKVATIESIGSSTRIEGAKLSDREIERLLSRLETSSFQSRDEEEVAGYAQTMEQIFTSNPSIPLTENYIKQLHQMLLHFSSKDIRHRGEYKKHPNRVEAFDEHGNSMGIIFDTATPFDTPAKMAELVSWTQEALIEKRLHPLLIIAVFIVCFLAIHPFQDGNGRLSRILTTLLLLREGYTYVPYSSLESVIEENKESYYLALRKTQGTLEQDAPDWSPWVLFFLRALERQKNRLEIKIENEKLIQASLPLLSIRILELLKEHGRLSTQDIHKVTGESRSTIKARLSDLVQSGRIDRHGRGRSTWYTLA